MFCYNCIVGRVAGVRLLSAPITFHLKYFSTKTVNWRGIAKLRLLGPWYYHGILTMTLIKKKKTLWLSKINFVCLEKLWFEFILNISFHSRIQIMVWNLELLTFFTLLNLTDTQTHWYSSFHYKFLLQDRMKWRKNVTSVWTLNGLTCLGCSGNKRMMLRSHKVNHT